MWKSAVALTLVGGLGATSASALSIPVNGGGAHGSNCAVSASAYNNGMGGFGYVSLRNGNVNLGSAGGASYFGGSVFTDQEITTAHLASCHVGAVATDITNLVQNGADATFATDDYIGFSYTYNGYDYEVALVGASNTQVVNTVQMTPILGPSVEDTQRAIANYMYSYAGHVVAAQPNLTALLSGNAANAFNAEVTRGNGTFNIATDNSQNVWARLKGDWSKSEDGEIKNSYFFGVAGVHTSLSPDTVVGLMLEFDNLTQTNGDTTTEGKGYLVGPYFVAKLPDQPLYVEGQFLAGRTENKVSFDDATTQDFDTRRTLARVKVAGQLNYSELVLTPSLSATQLKDTQQAFTDGEGRPVAEQGITVTDLAIGLDFAKTLQVNTGHLLLTGGISGIWSKTEGEGLASTITPDYEGGRARVHLGTSYTLNNGMLLNAGMNYDGIGSNYQSWGLELGIGMKF